MDHEDTVLHHEVTVTPAVHGRTKHWELHCTCEMNWPDAISEEQALEWKERHEERFHPPRPDWDLYFAIIAETVALRADCRRAKHGAVIVKDHRIVSTGYNASPAGGPSCLRGECPRGRKSAEELAHLTPDYSDCVALHAEQNAIAYANRADTQGATIYITGQPCDSCSKLIAAAGIVRVLYPVKET